MMDIKSSYNLLRLSLFKGEVFLDISEWWRSLHYQNRTHTTNFSPLHGETLFWHRCPSMGAKPHGQAAQASSVSVRAGDECGLWSFPMSELIASQALLQVNSGGWVNMQVVLMTRQPESEPCSALMPAVIEICSSPCLHLLNEAFCTWWDWSRQYCVKTLVEWGSGTKSSAGGNPPKPKMASTRNWTQAFCLFQSAAAEMALESEQERREKNPTRFSTSGKTCYVLRAKYRA